MKPNSLETKLLKFAISCNAFGHTKEDIRPADHPINQLDNIEHELFGHLSDNCNPIQTAKTILRKRRQLLEAVSEPVEVKIYFNFSHAFDSKASATKRNFSIEKKEQS